MLGTTASKVVRRSSSSQVTVPTTPVATTDAASAYVDLNTSLNFVGVGSATQNKELLQLRAADLCRSCYH